MKTYVITISERFPKNHERAGSETYFVNKIIAAIRTNSSNYSITYPNDLDFNIIGNKLHTCRSNYELWNKRIDEVLAGKAILSLRYWSGNPYKSKQVEFARLDRNSGIGLQKLLFIDSTDFSMVVSNPMFGFLHVRLDDVAKNDGLTPADFKEWFKGYDLSKPMAIIHFTSFRY